MEAVDIQAAVGDCHGLPHLGAGGSFDGWLAESDRYGRPGQEREAKVPRNLHHPLGLFPTVGKMLVIEHGCRAPAFAEHVRDFEEQLIARRTGSAPFR